AGRLRDRKLANIATVTPDLVAAGNIGCITQLAAGSSVPILHTVELLDWATGGPVPAVLRDRRGGGGADGRASGPPPRALPRRGGGGGPYPVFLLLWRPRKRPARRAPATAGRRRPAPGESW